jgi:hypothetical protein
MARTKLKIVRAILGFSGVSDSNLVSRLHAVHDGIVNNPAYPNPPIDIAAFRSAIDAYAAAIAAALDGGRTALTERDKRRAEMIIMLRQLGHYVEVACKGDMSTFVTSGFVPASTTRPPAQRTGQPVIASVRQGSNSGQLVVTIKAVPKARHYELRSGAVPAAGGAVNWTTMLLTATKPATVFNNLTPGGTYTFQVRAYGKLGYSDWSDTAGRMCI